MKRALIPFAVAAAALIAGCTSTPPAPLVPAGSAPRAIPAQVQAPSGLSDSDFDAWLTAQRARVSTERASTHQKFADAETMCWRRFAVNDCLRGARRERRAALDGLRGEELALNQQERERDTASRLKDLQDKQRAAQQSK